MTHKRKESIPMNMFKKTGGFTLVELIVVIAILAILAGVAIPAYSGYIAKAQQAGDLTDLNAIQTAVNAVYATETDLPATITAADRLAVAIEHKKRLSEDLDFSMELALLRNFTKLNKNLYAEIGNLQRALEKAAEQEGIIAVSRSYADQIVPTMGRIRKLADELETITPSELWPFPTYSDLLFYA